MGIMGDMSNCHEITSVQKSMQLVNQAKMAKG